MDGGVCAHICTYTHTYVQSTTRPRLRACSPLGQVPLEHGFDFPLGGARLCRAAGPAPAIQALAFLAPAYMVPDLSAELLGKSFSVGVTAGLPTPELLLLLERCCTTGRTGRIGGGRS